MEYAAYVIKYWPFGAVALILAVFGQFFSLKVFTKENAYAEYSKDPAGRLARFFFWWGRESLSLHPILAGFLIGYYWNDPLNDGSSQAKTMLWFGASGAVSLGVWVYLKAKAKEQGIVLELPGSSVPPLAPGALDVDSVLPPANDHAAEKNS